jgi:hypothetical protein
MTIEAETLITPDQERRASFLRKREEYASSLERIVAQARERSALCSPCQSTGLVAIAPINRSFTAMNESMTLTINVDYSFLLSSVFEDSENKVPITENSNWLSKRSALSREEGVMTKRAALDVLDSNARQSLRGEKGKSSRCTK